MQASCCRIEAADMIHDSEGAYENCNFIIRATRLSEIHPAAEFHAPTALTIADTSRKQDASSKEPENVNEHRVKLQ